MFSSSSTSQRVALSAAVKASVQKYLTLPVNDHYLLPPGDEGSHITPWLARTGWATHLAGRDANALTALVQPAKDEEASLKAFSIIVDQVLNHCNAGARLQSCPFVVRRMLKASYSHFGHMNSDEAVLCAPSAIFEEHKLRWNQFLCYLLRTHTHPADTGLVLSAQQLDILATVWDHLNREERDQDIIRTNIMILSVTILEQKMTGWPFDSPLLHFVAILGIDSDNLTWNPPHAMISTLGSLLHVGRLISLEHSIPAKHRQHDSVFVETFQQYYDKHLSPEAHSPGVELTELYQLSRSLGHVKRRDRGVWSVETETLWYHGQIITLRDIRTFVQSVLHEVEEFACKNLLFRPITTLTTHSPQLLRDDLTLTRNGCSFIDVPSNGLGNNLVQMTDALNSSSRLDQFVGVGNEGEVVLNSETIAKYIRDSRTFLEYLMVLLYFSCMHSPDPVVFLQAQSHNSWLSMRHLYVEGGAVVYVDPTSRASLPGMANFLPESVGRLYIAYIRDIRPFIQYLEVMQSISPQSLPAQNSMIFDPDFEISRSVEQFNHILEKVSTSHSTVLLGLDSWREIAVSINMDLANNHPLVSDLTGPRDDGLTYVPSLSPAVLRTLLGPNVGLSREAAERYHLALGFSEGLGSSPITIPSMASSRPPFEHLPQTPSTSLPRMSTPTKYQSPTFVPPSTNPSNQKRYRERPLVWQESPTKRPTRLEPPNQTSAEHHPGNQGNQGETDRNLLKGFFEAFSQLNPDPVCPVCWLAYGPESAKHLFAFCNHTAVNLAMVMDFKRNKILWPMKCHWGCGAPSYICRSSELKCKFLDILMSVVLFVYRSPKYLGLFNQLVPSGDISDDTKYGQQLTKPYTLYDVPTSVAVALFDQVVRSRLVELDMSLESFALSHNP